MSPGPPTHRHPHVRLLFAMTTRSVCTTIIVNRTVFAWKDTNRWTVAAYQVKILNFVVETIDSTLSQVIVKIPKGYGLFQ